MVADLQTVRTLQRDIQRQRPKANIIVPVPNKNDFHFVLPQDYCTIMTGEQFLQIVLGGRLLRTFYEIRPIGIWMKHLIPFHHNFFNSTLFMACEMEEMLLAYMHYCRRKINIHMNVC